MSAERPPFFELPTKVVTDWDAAFEIVKYGNPVIFQSTHALMKGLYLECMRRTGRKLQINLVEDGVRVQLTELKVKHRTKTKGTTP